MATQRLVLVPLLAQLALSAPAATHYVDLNSTNPTPPYSTWETAATNIQDAVDIATSGAAVIVGAGIYDTGWRTITTNETRCRVVVTTSYVTVCSYLGPEQTVIAGAGPLGTTAVRCAYLATNVLLSGFTLTNGHTRMFGSNFFGDRSGGGVFANGAILSNCIITGCRAVWEGGGVVGATLYDCSISDNQAHEQGGGVARCQLRRCTLRQNVGGYWGGGAYTCVLYECTLAGNTAGGWGAGADESILERCVLYENKANSGAGASDSTLDSCALYGNAAVSGGGGAASGCRLRNCTITRNRASSYGGGTDSCIADNCIIYYNEAPTYENYAQGTNRYTCSTPLPPGEGNIDAPPTLAGFSHISSSSPCKGAGSSAYASSLDIDGEAWSSPPSMGCDESVPESAIGALSVTISADAQNTVYPLPITYGAGTQGRITNSIWDFGDGTIVSNEPQLSHAWSSPGSYTVTLTAFNQTFPTGISTARIVRVFAEQPTHYTDAACTNPVPPYTNWMTAANSIQDAIDSAAACLGAAVIVTNGTYNLGFAISPNGWMTNRIVITNSVQVRSVKGAQQTTIEGFGRCAFLAPGCSLSGFTLSNGCTDHIFYGTGPDLYGGGAFAVGAAISNCIIRNNTSYYYGGGVYGGSLYNCLIIRNFASHSGGGGVSHGSLFNCTVSENQAYDGRGGAHLCAVTNCVEYYNIAYYYGNHSYHAYLQDTNTDPLFVNAAAGDYHLDFDSPYIDTGSNQEWMVGATDLDGNPRIFHANVDAGAYESQYPSIHLSVQASPVVTYTNRPVNLSAQIIVGSPTNTSWDFGDGAYATNQLSMGHAWQSGGVFSVTFRAYDEENPSGLSSSIVVRIIDPPIYVRYVDLNCASPVPPYATWDTAATNIQDAVDSTIAAGETILVADGVYSNGTRSTPGGTLPCRLVVSNQARVCSVSGPDATFIMGGGTQAIRCVYLESGTGLSGFTVADGRTLVSQGTTMDECGAGFFAAGAVISNCVITNCWASYFGGGAISGTLYNCTIAGNQAQYCGAGTFGSIVCDSRILDNRTAGGGLGGGAYRGRLERCEIRGNWASFGGGAYNTELRHCAVVGNDGDCTGGGLLGGKASSCLIISNRTAYYAGGAVGADLNGCTVVGNTADCEGGGVSRCLARNCIIYDNIAPSNANWSEGTNEFTCTVPEAPCPGNTTNDPLFVNAAAGDYRLATNSPCIDTGMNQDWMADATDLDGKPRILNGTVDMGCYELIPPSWDTDSDNLPDFWEWQYGHSMTGMAASADDDGDGFINLYECLAHTDATNELSYLGMGDVTPLDGGTGLVVRWSSAEGCSYGLQKATNLTEGFEAVEEAVPATPPLNCYTDLTAVGVGPWFYRVEVEP